MKKAWKLILTISLSVAGVGLVFCVAGFIMGASSKDVEYLFYQANGAEPVQKMEYLVRDVIDHDHDTDHGTHDTGHDGYETSYYEEYADESFNYDGIDELEVEVPAMEVVVAENSRSDTLVNLIDVPEKLRNVISISQDGGKLKIETEDDQFLKDLLKNDGYFGTLYIEVPEGTTFKKASLEIGAGTLTVDGIIRTKKLDVQVGAGDLYVPEFIADEVEVQCGTGEATLTGTVKEKIEIECGIGSVIFNDNGREEDYSYKLDCGIGNLEVGTQSYSGLGSTKEIKNGNAKKTMKIECGIGNVEVYFMEN